MKVPRFSFYFLMPITVLSILAVILLISRGSLGPQKRPDNSVPEEVVPQQKTNSAVVVGHVIDASGEPLHHYHVMATSADEEIIYNLRTDTHGRFEFSKLDKGHWEISVKLSEIILDSSKVQLHEGGYKTINFSLPMKGTISGTFVSSTNAIPLYIDGNVALEHVSYSWQIPSRIFTGTSLGGKFKFTGLPPGRYIVRNSIPGYALLRESNKVITVEPNQQVTGVEIPLEEGALVRGRLVDINSVAIPNLVVRIASVRIAPRTYSPTKYIREVRTNINGEFSTMVPCTTDRTHAFHTILSNPGFQGKRIKNNIVPGKDLYEIGDIQLEKTLELKGNILQNVGTGNLEVVLQRYGKSPAPMPIHVPTRQTTFVEPNGKFTISGLYPIPYTLTVLENRKVRYFSESVNPQESPSIKIAFPKTEIIQGQVTDIDGTPLDGANVTARIKESGVGVPVITLSESVSQDDGTFQFELLKVKPESLMLVVTKKGYLPKAHRKSSSEPQDDLKIVLEKGVSLVGYVMITPELSQEGDFTIKLFPIDMSMEPGTKRGLDDREPLYSRRFKRADGSFSIDGLARAVYRLYVVGEGLVPTNISVDLTEGSKEVNIFVKSSVGTLAGQLLWAHSKMPVENVLIRRSWYPWELEPYSMLGDFQQFEVSTNKHGIFEFQNVFEGRRYVLEVRCIALKTDKIDSERRVVWKKVEVFASKDAEYVIYVGKED